MNLVERYVFRTTAMAFLAGLVGLTGVIWTTQALRQFDLLTTKGQSLIVFLSVTGLIIPSLVMVIAPVALFIAVIYSLNKLNSDSELIVMSAAGLAPARLIRPFLALTVLVALFVAATSLVAMPWSFREIRDFVTKIRADFLTRVVREGTFTSLDQGFTFHYRERGGDGALLGVFMQDRRDPAKISTYVAEAGQTVEARGQNYLVLEKGSVQRQQPNTRDAAIIVFDRYAVDLAQFGSEGADAPYKPRERSTYELFTLDMREPYVARTYGQFRSELHDRFVNPLYAFAFGLIAFAALGQARTTRQGRGTAILAAVGVVLALRLLGFSVATLVAKQAWAVPLAYAVPLIGSVGALVHVFGWPIPAPLARARQHLAVAAP